MQFLPPSIIPSSHRLQQLKIWLKKRRGAMRSTQPTREPHMLSKQRPPAKTKPARPKRLSLSGSANVRRLESSGSSERQNGLALSRSLYSVAAAPRSPMIFLQRAVVGTPGPLLARCQQCLSVQKGA